MAELKTRKRSTELKELKDATTTALCGHLYTLQGLTASHTGVSFLHTVAGSCLASCSSTRLEPLTGTRTRHCLGLGLGLG